MNNSCNRAEVLAGAIALGEAAPEERDEYRRHLAQCAHCIERLGGEREIERVMHTIAEARDAEVWEPAALSVVAKRPARVARAWRTGFSVAALAVAASLGLHALVAALTPAPPASVVADRGTLDTPFHITLQTPDPRVRTAPVKAAPVSVAHISPRIVVVHNVITIKPQPQQRVASQRPIAAEHTTIVAENAPETEESTVPVWRRDAPMPSAKGASAVEQLSGHAESMAVIAPPVIHDALPVGGDTAINPRPPLIAATQGAQGTTAFEVAIDERGVPTHCAITKSSGFASLDKAVCDAAMRARFSPRTVNGRATVGSYSDAFTFRTQDATNEGIDQP